MTDPLTVPPELRGRLIGNAIARRKRGYGWYKNPWVAAITFVPHLCNIDKTETGHDTTRAIAQMNDTHTGPSVTCPASRHAAMISEALMSGAPYAMLAEAPEHCGASIADTVAALWAARAEVEQLRTAQRAAFIEGFMSSSRGCNGEYSRDGDPQNAAEAAADGWIADLVRKEGRR